MLQILYAILLINCFINAFVRRTRGALFTPNVKKTLSGLHSLILTVLIIIAGINFSWWHILYMFLADTIAYFPSAYIMKVLIP